MKKMDKKSLDEASRIYDEMNEVLDILYDRWQLERGYEDFEEYKKVITFQLKELRVTPLKVTKRPFGFTTKIGEFTIRVKRTANEYSCKRLVA